MSESNDKRYRQAYGVEPPDDSRHSRVFTPAGRRVTVLNSSPHDGASDFCPGAYAIVGGRVLCIFAGGDVEIDSLPDCHLHPNRWPLPDGTLEKIDELLA